MAAASAALEQLLAALPALNTRGQLLELSFTCCSPVSGRGRAGQRGWQPGQAHCDHGRPARSLQAHATASCLGRFERAPIIAPRAHTFLACCPALVRRQVFGAAPISCLWALGMQSLRQLRLDYSDLGGDVEVSVAWSRPLWRSSAAAAGSSWHAMLQHKRGR